MDEPRVLHNNPPPIWKLTLALRKATDTSGFARAQDIMHSYLTPSQYSRTVVDARTVQYHITGLEPPLDRSIAYTILYETTELLHVTWEDITWLEES